MTHHENGGPPALDRSIHIYCLLRKPRTSERMKLPGPRRIWAGHGRGRYGDWVEEFFAPRNETTVETMVCGYVHGNLPNQGFLAGAKWISSIHSRTVVSTARSRGVFQGKLQTIPCFICGGAPLAINGWDTLDKNRTELPELMTSTKGFPITTRDSIYPP